MSEYKQYNYSGPDELWYNFSGRYTKLLRTRTGIMFNSSTNKYAKVSGMLLSEKIQGYKYKTYIIKVVAAALTESAQPYIYTGFSQNPENRTIIGPATPYGEYLEYSVQFTLPETQLFDFGVFFSQRNNVINTVAVNSISLSCMEDDYYVLTHKDSVINSNKDFSGNSITVKKIILDQIEPTGNLNMNGHILTDVGGITLSEDMALHTLSISNAELVVDNAIVLTDSNYEAQIGNHYVSNPASQGLDMNFKPIQNTNYVSFAPDDVKVDGKPILSIQSDTSSVLSGLSINILNGGTGGSIYDSCFNKPPFISLATSGLNMDQHEINGVSYIYFQNQQQGCPSLSIQNIALNNNPVMSISQGPTGISYIYDTLYNPLPDNLMKTPANQTLDMTSHNIINLQEIDMVAKTGTKGIAIEVDPLTGFMRYTTGSTGGVDIWGTLYDTEFNQPPFGATATSDLNMNINSITNVSSITLKPTSGSLKTLSLDVYKNLTYDSNIILTEGNFSNFIMGNTGITGMTGGSSWTGTAKTDLNMGSHDIIHLNEIDMVGADSSTLALSIDPITKLFRYTTGEWIENDLPNYGLIYDSKFNKPPFNGVATSPLVMNLQPINNTTYISFVPNGFLQPNKPTLGIQSDNSSPLSGLYVRTDDGGTGGKIYDSCFNKPPFNGTATSALNMNSNPIENTTYIGFAPIGISGYNKPSLTIQSDNSSTLSGLSVCTHGGVNPGLIYDSYYNKPPFGATATSDLNMNFKAITDVFYQTFKNQNTQVDADTLSFQCQQVNGKSLMTIQQGQYSPQGIIYDSNYNPPTLADVCNASRGLTGFYASAGGRV
jgi:hypothetical protein